MFEKILVCLDGSKLAEQILPYATEEALRFKSRMILLQVMTAPTSLSMGSPAGPPAQSGDIIQEVFQMRESEARNYLERIAESLKERGVNAEPVILQPEPAGEAIVAYARANGIDLICIATHGHSGLGRVIFGSVADYVLRESGLPILVIKPKEDKQ